MVNTAIKANNREWGDEALERFKALLEGIPFVSDVRIKRVERPSSHDTRLPSGEITVREAIEAMETAALPSFHDAVVHLRIGNKTWSLLVAIKADASPRALRMGVMLMDRDRLQANADYAVLLGRYVSPQSAEICRQHGTGYADLAGNCHLSFGQVYIEREGHPNPFVAKREQRSLFMPKSERILRALLDPQHVGDHWTFRELAAQAEPGVSLGYVHKVTQRLLDQEFLRETALGLRLNQPMKLLEEWGRQYRQKRNRWHRMFSLQSPPKLKEGLVRWSRKSGVSFAFSSFTAAEHLAPHVRQPRLYFYLQSGPADLPSELEIKLVDSGENVIVMEPYDGGVFYGVANRKPNDPPVSGPIQTYLDVITSGGRGEEAAEAILEQVLKPVWKKDRLL